MSPVREQNRLAQRTKILESARTLFAERGPGNVTMAQIAERAGVSRVTVFNYFGSKGALIEGITEVVFARYRELLETALAERDRPVPDTIRELYEFMGAGVERQRSFYRAVFQEMAKLTVGVDVGGPSQVARQAARETLEHLLTRGQARGEISRELRPEDMASAFDSLLFGTITHWLYDDASEPLGARMLRAADVILRPVETDAFMN